MALSSSTNSMLQRINGFVEFAENSRHQLMCLAQDSGTVSSNMIIEDDTAKLWVKTSMERIEHFLQTQKYSYFISSPVHLGEYASNMIVEQMLMSTAIKHVASELQHQCSKSSLTTTNPKSRLTNNAIEIEVFGRASLGDPFFNETPNSTIEAGQLSKPLKRKRGERRKSAALGAQKQQTVFCPAVKDYFNDLYPVHQNPKLPVEIGSRFSDCKVRRMDLKSKACIQESEKMVPGHSSQDFPLNSLGSFIRCGIDPVREADRKYRMQDDTVNAFLNVRNNQKVIDFTIRKPNLVDISREFLIEVTVYGQTKADDTSGLNVCSSIATYKIEVLGSQSLADLRDALMCDNGFIFTKELYHPDDVQDTNELAQNKLLSAMLLIDNTIYNETRWHNNFDYATQIIQWTRRQPHRQAGPFKRGDMSTTKLEDLTIQFGFPYLFRHLGDCEHIIVFNKARLLTVDDEHRLSYFPRTSWISDIRPKLCRIDNEFIATWAVLDYASFPESPMLICSQCLKAFCYTEFGAKRGQFRLFPYRQLICEIPLPNEPIPKRVFKLYKNE